MSGWDTNTRIKRIIAINPNFVIFCLALLLPSLAYANAGLPMLTINLPILVVCLVPVVGIEALVLAYKINIPIARSLKVVGFANLISTCIGLPIVWALLVILQSAGGNEFFSFGYKTFWEQTFSTIGFFPWLVPYDWLNKYHVTLAAVVLNVAFFFASFWIERLLTQKQLPELDKKLISRAILYGNMMTYAILIPLTISIIMYLPNEYQMTLRNTVSTPLNIICLGAWIFFLTRGYRIVFPRKRQQMVAHKPVQ